MRGLKYWAGYAAGLVIGFALVGAALAAYVLIFSN